MNYPFKSAIIHHYPLQLQNNPYKFQEIWICHKLRPGARFTKQSKLALERNSTEAPMGGEYFAGDLLTMCTLKNTDAARSFP